MNPTGQFSSDEVEKTQSIARLRIHVERAIRRMKENEVKEKTLEPTLDNCMSAYKL